MQVTELPWITVEMLKEGEVISFGLITQLVPTLGWLNDVSKSQLNDVTLQVIASFLNHLSGAQEPTT